MQTPLFHSKGDKISKLILVKLGGSVITDINKPKTPKLHEIRRLINEIKVAGKHKKIIIGHGGGSFPHVPAQKYKVSFGFINSKSAIGTSVTQRSASELHHIIINEMIKAGLSALSFPPSSGAVANKKRIISWNTKAIVKALSLNFVPVVYGDITLDNKQGVCVVSTEEVFRYLATKLKPTKIIIGTDVDGVFSADPQTVKDAKIITKIGTSDIRKVAFSSINRKYNVTGSMQSKVKLLCEISKKNSVTCQIVNARIPGRIHDAILGKPVISTIIKF